MVDLCKKFNLKQTKTITPEENDVIPDGFEVLVVTTSGEVESFTCTRYAQDSRELRFYRKAKAKGTKKQKDREETSEYIYAQVPRSVVFTYLVPSDFSSDQLERYLGRRCSQALEVKQLLEEKAKDGQLLDKLKLKELEDILRAVVRLSENQGENR